MKRQILWCTVAALLLAPVAAGAAVDVSGRLTRGDGMVGLRIDSATGTVWYTIVSNIDLESAEIRRGNAVIVDLDIRPSFGSASGTVTTKANLKDLEARPNSYSVVLNDGESSTRLVLNGDSNEADSTPIDLANVGTTASRNGRLAARIRNRGKADSIPTSVTFYLSTDDQLSNNDVELIETAVGSIKPGKKQKVVAKINWPANAAGEERFVIAVVDEPDVNNDPNPSNNADATNKAVNIPD